MVNQTLTVLFAVLLPFGAFSQGYLYFDTFGINPLSYSTVTISSAPGSFNPADGPAGAFVGSNYTASLVFVNGTVTDQATFNSLNPIWVADTLFLGTTGLEVGHRPDVDGSGLFDGGLVQLPGLIFGYGTFQVYAWNNGGGLYTSYSQALASGHNVGRSSLLPVVIVLPPGPIVNLEGLQSFTVGIPEPSAIMLAALGGAALLVSRRRRFNRRI